MKCPKCGTENTADAARCATCAAPLKAIDPADRPKPTPTQPGIREPEPATDKPAAKTKFEPGAVVAGRYEILSLIGEGGMGAVYKANDQRLSRVVALKAIRADRMAGEAAVKRLIAEGALSRDIRHPNVVAVYDVDEVDGLPLMSMEYLEGKTLRAWNRERAQTGTICSMVTAARISLEILAGLEAAHKAGVIHRDLTPENVMLLSEPNDQGVKLKIMDFGIARVAGTGDTGATAMGKIGYMAPEQMTAPDSVNASADLYSVSAMLYELLAGVLPTGFWQPPSQGRSDVPPGMDELIQRGLSNNPSLRPQSAADYRKLMQDAAGGKTQPGPRPRPTPTPGPQPFVPKPQPGKKVNWGLWAAIGGGAIVVLGIIAAMSEGGDGLGPETSKYARMSGYWTDDFGDTWNVSVSGAGMVNGQATAGPLGGSSMAGQFQGDQLNMQMSNMNGTSPATGMFDNECHIALTLPNPNGYGTVGTQMHINHQPGAPCP